MKSPRFKQGQRVRLGAGKDVACKGSKQPPLEHGKPYTVSYHIWSSDTWYLVLDEVGALTAYDEKAFAHYESFITV